MGASPLLPSPHPLLVKRIVLLVVVVVVVVVVEHFHPFTQLLTHPFNHSLTHSLTHSFVQLDTHLIFNRVVQHLEAR